MKLQAESVVGLILIIVSIVTGSPSNSSGFLMEAKVTALITRLLQNFGSNGRYVYPEIGSNRSQVNMSFQILHFYGLDQNEILEIGVWTAFLWRDPRLEWNSTEYGGLKVIKVPADNIWIPDVGLSNTKKENQFDFRLLKAVEALVYPNGTVYIYYHLVTTVACPIDVMFFPFDSQKCDFQFGPWTSYRGSYRIHLPKSNIRMANISKFVSEWEIISFSIEEKNFFDDNVNQMWDYFEVKIEVRRKPYYYIFVIVVPFFMLSFMACLMFLADEAGDRVSMSIAILLTMTLYVMITSSSAPKSMQTIPLLGIYIMIQMALLIMFTFLAIRSNLSGAGGAGPVIYYTEDANGLLTKVKEKRVRRPAPLATPTPGGMEFETPAGGSAASGLELEHINRKPRRPPQSARRREPQRQDCFFMALYIGLTLTNVCVCMVILPAAKYRM